MTRAIGLLAMLGVFFVVGSARAAPSWCKGKGNDRVQSGSWDDAVKQDDVMSAIPAIVGCLCDQKCGSSSSDFAEHGAAVEESRKKWSARLEMTDDDWADAAEWSTQMASSRGSHDLPNEKDNLAWSTLDPVGQYILIQSEGGQSNRVSDASYKADAFGAHLSESGRLAYVKWCLDNSNHHEVVWAMCEPDVAALDPKKIAAELHADKEHSGFQRFMIRLAMERVRSELMPRHAAAVKEATGKDPAYAEMFKIAGDTRKEWDALWRSDAALAELALAMDDARATDSRRAFAGCDDKTWPAFKAAVSSIPAKDFANIETDIMKWKAQPRAQLAQIIVATPKGYLAASAHYICHSGDDKADPNIRALAGALLYWPGFRGPRNATQIHIASAGLQLDDRSAKIEYPSVSRPWFSRHAGGSSSGGGNGVVAAIKPQNDLMHVEFTKVSVKEPRCAVYKYTHRLTGIDSTGRFTYESACSKEVMVSVDVTSSPVNVKKRYVEGVRPGMKLWATEDAVEVVWPRAGTRTPTFVFGAPVK
jgi:hypothetical protein